MGSLHPALNLWLARGNQLVLACDIRARSNVALAVQFFFQKRERMKNILVCNFYTGRQSHMCLSVSVFELTEPELPPRQGTEAAGSSNATANTRTAQLFNLN